MIQDSQTPSRAQQGNPFATANYQAPSTSIQSRPPSIVLRSSAKQLTSTTSTATYCPVQSNQFNTSISKQPIVLVPHRHTPSPLKQYVSQPGITLVSNSPYVSVRSIPPSSRVLIRPSSSISNMQEHRQSNPELIRQGEVTTRIGGQYVNNMLNAMKVELEQMNINFSNKLSQEIQKQNEQDMANLGRQIQRLQKTLKDNQNLIRVKDEEIHKLREKVRASNLSRQKQWKEVEQIIDENHEYLSGKIRDAKTKLSLVADKLDSIRPSGDAKETLLLRKIEQMAHNLNCVMSSQVDLIKQSISSISQKYKGSLSSLQKKVDTTKRQTEKSLAVSMAKWDKQSFELNGCLQKLNQLQKLVAKLNNVSVAPNTQQLQQYTCRLQEKQSKLESHINHLQTDISQKILTKRRLEEQFNQLCSRLLQGQKLAQAKQRELEVKEKQMRVRNSELDVKNRQLEVQNRQLQLKRKQYQQKMSDVSKQVQKFQLESQVLRSQHTNKTRSNIVEKGNTEQPVLHRIPSAQSIESLSVSTSSRRSKVQMVSNYPQMSVCMKKSNNTFSMKDLSSSQKLPNTPKLSPKLIDLQNMLRQAGKKLPLRCEIDEAGVLKSYLQGTYIFNQKGDVFSLNQSQLRLATKSKLIYL